MNKEIDNQFDKPSKSPLRRLGAYLSEHGPGFLRRTQLQGLYAYRRGSKALATDAFSSTGIDLKSGCIAVALTVLLYLAFNAFLSFYVSSVFASHKPFVLATVNNLSEAKRALVVAGWIPAKAESTFKLNISDDSFKLPLHRWIELEFLASSTKTDELQAQFRKLVCGNPSGIILVNSKITTAGEVYGALLKNYPAVLEAVERDPVRKRLCNQMLDDLVSTVQQAIRWQLRINGSIQFLTAFVGFLVLVAVIRRYFFITRLAGNWLGENLRATMTRSDGARNDQELRRVVDRLSKSTDIDADTVIQNEVDRLSRDSTEHTYNTYWYVAGMLPSLGFIGTVVGMSSSLMLADRLIVASPDQRQLAIGKMTAELALAFDTTLVALLFGLIAGIPIAAVHARERRFFREFAIGIADYRRNRTRLEVTRVESR